MKVRNVWLIAAAMFFGVACDKSGGIEGALSDENVILEDDTRKAVERLQGSWTSDNGIQSKAWKFEGDHVKYFDPTMGDVRTLDVEFRSPCRFHAADERGMEWTKSLAAGEEQLFMEGVSGASGGLVTDDGAVACVMDGAVHVLSGSDCRRCPREGGECTSGGVECSLDENGLKITDEKAPWGAAKLERKGELLGNSNMLKNQLEPHDSYDEAKTVLRKRLEKIEEERK